MKENLVKARKKTSFIVICSIGILFFMFLAILFWNNFLEERNLGCNEFFAPIVFVCGSFFCLYSLLQAPNLFYNSVKIELRNVFGKVKKSILLADIEGWAVQQKSSKYESWEDFTFITKDQRRHKLHSYHFDDYEAVKNLLKRGGKKKSTELKKELERRQNIKYAVAILLIGILFFAIAFVQKNTLELNETKEINGVLSEDIFVEKYKKTRTFYIYLENYPEVDFEIKDNVLLENYESLIQNYKRGSSISFKISLKDFEKKLQSNPDLNLIEKYCNGYESKIVQLEDKNNTYVSLESYNSVIRENNKSKMLFFGFVGILCLIISAVFYKNRDKMTE
ncbi:hypothetical protein [Flavobacterium foetidum]|uniref:hypothetical protein n=1 Tax=Flavobacterium foetidum TaxID=2026681 RepID=UPI001074B1B8|nr:hypothetical protein [Flavobacterium foetidum]KAF2515293.1 hypothetical protein E0W73_10175 [Flavobacterium foetidum]